MGSSFDAEAVRAWAVGCVERIDAIRPELNALNVFPVPDRDTGENLFHTLRGAADAVASEDLDEALAQFAAGALASARGSSGVIVSEALRGIASACAGIDGNETLRRGFTAAEPHARAALLRPVEGTILTVMRVAAAALQGDDAAADAHRMAEAARLAVLATRDQLSTLHDAGVVDAGARGWLVMLEALDAVLNDGSHVAIAAGARPASAAAPVSGGEGREWVFGWPVTREQAAAVLAPLAGVTDVVIGGADGALRVHLHVTLADCESARTTLTAVAPLLELRDRALFECAH